jgi:hypothetical protein
MNTLDCINNNDDINNDNNNNLFLFDNYCEGRNHLSFIDESKNKNNINLNDTSDFPNNIITTNNNNSKDLYLLTIPYKNYFCRVDFLPAILSSDLNMIIKRIYVNNNQNNADNDYNDLTNNEIEENINDLDNDNASHIEENSEFIDGRRIKVLLSDNNSMSQIALWNQQQVKIIFKYYDYIYYNIYSYYLYFYLYKDCILLGLYLEASLQRVFSPKSSSLTSSSAKISETNGELEKNSSANIAVLKQLQYEDSLLHFDFNIIHLHKSLALRLDGKLEKIYRMAKTFVSKRLSYLLEIYSTVRSIVSYIISCGYLEVIFEKNKDVKSLLQKLIFQHTKPINLPIGFQKLYQITFNRILQIYSISDTDEHNKALVGLNSYPSECISRVQKELVHNRWIAKTRDISVSNKGTISYTV